MKLILSLIACCAFAFGQAKPQAHPGAAPATKTSSSPAATSSSIAPISSARYETFTNVTIPAGQSVNLDSTIDYSSSDTVRVTLRSPNPDLLHLIGTAWFMVPNASEFVTQEVMLGTDFNYSNAGGATFQVCGSQFRITLQNTGATAMTLSTVLLYTHVL